MNKTLSLLVGLLLSMTFVISSINAQQDKSYITRDMGSESSPTGDTPEALACDDTAYNQEFDEDNFNTGRTSDREAGFEVADNFTLAEDYEVNSICFWGIYVDFDTFTDCGPAVGNGDDAFEITYYVDNAGEPGAVHAGPFPVTHTREAIGVPFAFTEIFGYDVTHPPVLIPGGTQYWVSITNDSPGTCFWLWVDNTAAPNDGQAYQFGPTATPILPTDQTFNLGGLPSAMEVVPTMGEWGIIVLSMLMLIFGTVAVTQRSVRVQTVKA